MTTALILAAGLAVPLALLAWAPWEAPEERERG